MTKLNPTGSAPLVYSTYLGGVNDDDGRGIAVDAMGNAFIIGTTDSPTFPVTAGAFQTTLSCPFFCTYDAFVAKLNASGSALVYSTFFGGSVVENGSGIALDGTGNAYVTGLTTSYDFPTTVGAFQTAASSNSEEAFVAKLNPTGSALGYSTFLGGSGDDRGSDIRVDALGNAFVTGFTRSSNFPTTVGAFQTTYGGGDFDSFVAKLNAAGSGLVFSTYLGGSGDEVFGNAKNDLAIDALGNVYAAGTTASMNFPTTSGAFQPTFAGVSDAYVTKLNASGSALLYSTYLGGSGQDQAFGIAVDSLGDAHITGLTTSANFPLASALQLAPFGGFGPFVTRLNAAGTALVYSTYLGGGFGLDVAAASGQTYATGYATSFPTTSGAFQTIFAGITDGFVAKIGEAVLPVPVDIKPRSCPNPLTTRDQGQMSVAIVGAGALDVTKVDPASVRLEGVAPLRSSLEDVSAPFTPFTGKTDCHNHCSTAGPDGIQDLTLRFDLRQVLAALSPPAAVGQCRVFKLTGNLKAEFGGTPIVGEDVVTIVGEP